MSRNKLNEIIGGGKDDDGIWCGVHDLILENKKEEAWNEVETCVIILGNMDRWVLNGGFESYLCMPAGAYCSQAISCLERMNEQLVLQALLAAVSCYPSGFDLDDVDSRQRFVMPKAGVELLRKSNLAYYAHSRKFYEKMRLYIVSHRAELDWINNLK